MLTPPKQRARKSSGTEQPNLLCSSCEVRHIMKECDDFKAIS